jgi:hypothetical protein
MISLTRNAPREPVRKVSIDVRSPEEITAIWREVLFFCQGTLAVWQGVHAFEPVTQGLIDEYRKQLEQLKAAATEHFQFHNGLE